MCPGFWVHITNHGTSREVKNKDDFWKCAFKLIIGPLELLLEVIFMFANHIFNNLGWPIVLLSIVMNFLLLPLYNRADAIQKETSDTEKRLRPRIKRIKNAFKGDE